MLYKHTESSKMIWCGATSHLSVEGCVFTFWELKMYFLLKVSYYMALSWLSRVPWTARKSSQSIQKEISPEYSLEGLMLKLKLQYFGHLMWRTDSFEKTLMLGKIEGKRNRGRVNSGRWWWTGKRVCCSPWGRKESDTTEQLNWTEFSKLTHNITTLYIFLSFSFIIKVIYDYFWAPLVA